MSDRRWIAPTDRIADLLAIYRLTRLVTADTITHGPREAIVRWAYGGDTDVPVEGLTWSEMAEEAGPNAPKLATLITCRWCTSVWVAAGVLAARRWAPDWWNPVAHILAGSAIGTLLAGLEEP